MSHDAMKSISRVQRTRLALRDALMALIEEKGFDAIIVQDIADRAMINRVTFYKHYQDKYDLLEQTMREQLADLVAPVQTLLREPGDQVVYNAIVRWLEQVAQHASFFRIMLGKSGNAAFATQLLVYLETIVRMEARRQRSFQMPSPPQDKVRLRFIAAGFLGVTGWWLEQKQALSVHEVAMQLHTLLNTVMHAPTDSLSPS